MREPKIISSVSASMRKTTIFKVQMFGRDSLGHSIARDLSANFSTFELAVEAAEATADVSGSMTSYRITDARGKSLLDVEVCGSRRRFTHRDVAA
jgi:hypothetical protein